METLILIVAVGAAIGGGWILLSCLAGRRAELVRAFNIHQKTQVKAAELAANVDTQD